MRFINLRERKKRLRLINFFLPVVTAFLFCISFAPYHPSFRFFILLAFIPYLYAVLHCKKRKFLTGFIFGFLSNGCLFWWITVVNVEDVNRAFVVAGVVLLILLLSVYWGLVAILISRIKRTSYAIFAFPFMWVSLEFVRSLTSELGFSWGSVGYAFACCPSMLQIASITGLAGVSFSILFYNSLIYWSMIQRRWKKGLIGLLIFVVLFLIQVILGNRVLSRIDEVETVKISLIQANILPEVKRENEVEERITVLSDMTIDAAIRGSDLVVWSETSIPCYYREDSECINDIKDLVRKVGVPVIAGAPEYVVDRKRKERYRYNSAFLISADGRTIGKYRKIYLVPFGEHLPFDNTFPVLRNVHFGQGDYSAGRELTVFSCGKFRFSVLICFESIFPRLVRKFVKNGAELLVNITEDSWYRRTPGPYQHAEMAILRAVENRVSVVRCGNSGISMLIDPYGRILKKSKIFERMIIDGEVPLREGTSFYTRYGDLFTWVIVVISFILFVFSFVPSFAKKFLHHK